MFDPLLTRENITLALSIFGSIGTSITLISSYLTKRKNLKINIASFTYKSHLQRLALLVTFENRSRLPISVTSISCSLHGKIITPIRYPQGVGEYIHRIGKDIVDKKFEYNLSFPADIQQLCAVSGYILFDISQEDLENLSTPLILQVHSTRGRAQKIELQPSQIEWF